MWTLLYLNFSLNKMADAESSEASVAAEAEAVPVRQTKIASS